MVVYPQGVRVGAEVHEERTHDGVVVEVDLARERIQVRHKTIAEPVVIEYALVGGGTLRGDVPEFAPGPLPVGAEDGDEGSELVPAGLHLPPFFGICRIVELVHHAEAAYVHAPERDAAHAVAQAGRNLSPHVFPRSADIPAPGSGGIALQARETAAGEEKDPLVGIHLPLSVIDGIGVHQRVSVEVFGRGPKSRRRGEQLLVGPGLAVAQVGFARIHPPRIYLPAVFAVEVLVHLAPEHLLRVGVVGIVEGLGIAEEVHKRIFDRLHIYIAVFLHLREVRGVGIELRPYRNHIAAVHGVDVVQHLLRVGKALFVELMAAPLVRFPVLPVLHDVVDGDAPAAELCEGGHDLFLGGIAFAALPEAHGPARHHLRLACEGAVAGYDRVGRRPCDEVVIDAWIHLAPEAEPALLLGSTVWSRSQAGIGHGAVRPPVHPQRGFLPCLEVYLELHDIRVPGRTPYFAHHFLAGHADLLEARIIQAEIVISVIRGDDITFESHFGPLHRYLRQVPYCPFVFVVYGFFAPGHGLAVRGGIGCREGPFLSVPVVELEHFTQLQIPLRVAETAHGIAVPEHSVSLAAHEEGHGNLRVVLVQLDVVALVVEQEVLLLPESVDGLVRRAVPFLGYRILGPALYGYGLEAAAVFFQERIAVEVGETHPTIVHHRLERLRGEGDVTLCRLHLEIGAAFLRQHHQALPFGECSVGRGTDADDLGCHHLQPKQAVGGLYGYGVALAGIIPFAACEGEQGGEREKDAERFHRPYVFISQRYKGF